MSDKNLNYIPQLSDTMNNMTTERHNQITFPDIPIAKVDTTCSEKDEKLKVYGSNIKVKSPSRMGNLFTFLFISKQPIFTIGPQCKII
jgi:hypothetical protein